MKGGGFVGSSALGRFFWRQERRQAALWCAVIVLLNLLVVLAYNQIYQSEAERQAMAETMSNPAMTFMLGPGYGLDDYTIGAMVGHEMLLFAALAAAVMNILLVNAQTRGAEEDGRQELLLSLPVGRLSSLGAVFALAVAKNLGLALLTAAAMWGAGVESVDLAGSLLFGMVLGVTGLFFGGLTALFAQLTEAGRANLALSLGALGVMYVVRGMGDLGREWLALISPLGLILRSQVYVRNFWWPVWAMLGLGILLWLGAFGLKRERDLGAGLIRWRPERKASSRLLGSPLALAFRLQRTTIISWIGALFFLGLSYGSVFGDLEAFLAGNEFLKDILPAVQGYSLTEQFLGMVVLVMAMMAVIPGLLAVLRLGREEAGGRLESLLALPVTRLRLLASFTALSVLVSGAAMLVSGLGLWLAASVVVEEGLSLPMMLRACLAQLPAMLAMTSASVLVMGFRPRWSGLVWGYLGYSFFAVYFGVLVRLPEWMAKLSPFGFSPQLPVEPFEPLTAAALGGVSLALWVLGSVGYVKRDIGV